MMMRVRVLTPAIVISILIFSACTKDESAGLMPVTTDSELALELYETGLLAYDQLKLELAWHNFQLAIKEDPNFFMAHYWMYSMTSKKSKEVAEDAFQSDVELNEGEKLIRTSLKYLIDGQDEKVVENLKIVVDLYPKDPQVHKLLYLRQYQYMKDMEGAIESILRCIEEVPDYASAYNYLGYAHMYQEEFEKSEEAFNNYIRLAPKEANPYDSKGDFFMETKQLEEAYESYMKAYEIDSRYFEVSKKKAMKAKQMMEKVNT
jgi:tetratricopeptide (TPR) repeat protein